MKPHPLRSFPQSRPGAGGIRVIRGHAAVFPARISRQLVRKASRTAVLGPQLPRRIDSMGQWIQRQPMPTPRARPAGDHRRLEDLRGLRRRGRDRARRRDLRSPKRQLGERPADSDGAGVVRRRAGERGHLRHRRQAGASRRGEAANRGRPPLRDPRQRRAARPRHWNVVRGRIPGRAAGRPGRHRLQGPDLRHRRQLDEQRERQRRRPPRPRRGVRPCQRPLVAGSSPAARAAGSRGRHRRRPHLRLRRHRRPGRGGEQAHVRPRSGRRPVGGARPDPHRPLRPGSARRRPPDLHLRGLGRRRPGRITTRSRSTTSTPTPGPGKPPCRTGKPGWPRPWSTGASS